jgi:GT2 family glycosyltransferase
MPVDLRISIVNHSNPEMLRDCIESIYRTTLRSLEIWVIDNATGGRMVDEIQTEFPKVRWKANHVPRGFSANHNQVLREAAAGYSIILNDDVLVHDGAFDTLADYLDKHPKCGMAGPRLLNADGTIQNSTFRFMSLKSELAGISILPAALAGWKAIGIDPAQWADQATSVDWVLGACIITRQEVLSQVGMLDEELSPIANTEEVDWCYRVHKAGWSIDFVPSALVTHFGGQSMKADPTNVGPDKFCVEMYRTRLAFFRKHYGILRSALLRSIYALTLPVNLLMLWQGARRNRISSEYRKSHSATLRAIAALPNRKRFRVRESVSASTKRTPPNE